MKTLHRVAASIALAATLAATGCGQVPLRAGVATQATTGFAAKGRAPLYTDGNAVKLLVDGPAIFDSMNDAISKAQHSIQIHAFQFGGETGMRLARNIIERRKAGVEVQVLIDPNLGGAPSIKKQILEVLSLLDAVGIEHRLYNLKDMPKGPTWLSKLGMIDHSKVLVVDGRVAYIGGMNFYDDGAENHDYMMRIEGPMATQIGEVSNADWVHAGGEAGVIKLQAAAPAGHTKVEFAQNSPETSNIRAMMARYFNQATRKIWIEVLFLDDDTIIDALVAAKKRGVDVRVILDPLDWGNHVKELDKLPFDGIPNWAAVNDCLEAGIPVSWFKPYHEHQNLHAKIAEVDGRYVICGSANFTYRAYDRNRENTVAVEAPELAAQFDQVFMADEADASRIASLNFWQKRLAGLFERVKRGIYNPRTDLPAQAAN